MYVYKFFCSLALCPKNYFCLVNVRIYDSVCFLRNRDEKKCWVVNLTKVGLGNEKKDK